MDLIEPKDVTIDTHLGPRRYVLSKWPAVQGRELVAKYPVANLPKLGDYAASEDAMLKNMSFVEAYAPDETTKVRLVTRALIDNHVPDWETLARLEAGMAEYNVSFFGQGKSFDFFASIGQTLRAWLTQTLMDLSAASSGPTKPRSTN